MVNSRCKGTIILIEYQKKNQRKNPFRRLLLVLPSEGIKNKQAFNKERPQICGLSYALLVSDQCIL